MKNSCEKLADFVLQPVFSQGEHQPDEGGTGGWVRATEHFELRRASSLCWRHPGPRSPCRRDHTSPALYSCTPLRSLSWPSPKSPDLCQESLDVQNTNILPLFFENPICNSSANQCNAEDFACRSMSPVCLSLVSSGLNSSPVCWP